VHQITLVINGVHLLENMKLDELVERRVYKFASNMQPLKIKGGTGSTVPPLGSPLDRRVPCVRCPRTVPLRARTPY
jgi:hypothetical protein